MELAEKWICLQKFILLKHSLWQKMTDIWLFLDKIWCNGSLLSSTDILPLCSSLKETRSLTKLRIFSAVAVSLELIGLSLLLYGAMWNVPLFFVLGVSLKIISHLGAGILHNHSGVFLNLWWTRQLFLINTYQKEFSGLLNHVGLTDAEIKTLPNLPTELYHTELNSYPYTFFLNFFTPLVCAGTLCLHGNIFSALLIGAVGMASLPLGRWFYEQFSFRQQREQRLAQTADAYDYLEAIYKQHMSLTLKVNILTQLPLALFTASFALGISSSFFANYLAFTMGLAGLTGLLAFQKLRVGSQQTIDKAKHLLSILSGPEFLLTPYRWKEHVSKKSILKVFPSFKNGIVIREFTPTAFEIDKLGFKPLSIAIPFNESYILQAPSGYGKSMLLLAILHMLNHEGDIFLMENGMVTNVHELDKEDWQKSVIFFREEDLKTTSRLVDLFNEVLITDLKSLFDQMFDNFGAQLTTLAWKGSDNLIENEIVALQNQNKSPFPSKMISSLMQMRQQRRDRLSKLLKKGFSDSDRIHPERIFCTLSTGEQRRLINLLTIEQARTYKNTRFVILDEPFAHLDEENIHYQLQLIAELQLQKALPLLIISHHHIEEICNTLVSVKSPADYEANFFDKIENRDLLNSGKGA